MIRPCYLVVDSETPNGISTRKLVIETAKFNVITAYTAQESVEILRRFPNLDGAVVDSGIEDIPCDELVATLKQIKPALTVVVICSPRKGECPHADYNLESFAPEPLLALLRKLNPEATQLIEKRNEFLADHKS